MWVWVRKFFADWLRIPDVSLPTPVPVPIDDDQPLTPGEDNLDDFPEFDGGLKSIPVGLAERDRIYGRPVISIGASGRFKVDRSFARRLSTIPAREFRNYHRRLYCHKIFHAYFIEAMRRAYEICPSWKPKKIGCFNPRRMRHSKDPRVPFSDHTYGIAVDIDPGRNRAFSRKKYPDRPKPFDVDWDIYSQIPEGVVLAFESVGFDWGGRWKNYCDPMHFSLRKLGK